MNIGINIGCHQPLTVTQHLELETAKREAKRLHAGPRLPVATVRRDPPAPLTYAECLEIERQHRYDDLGSTKAA